MLKKPKLWSSSLLKESAPEMKNTWTMDGDYKWQRFGPMLAYSWSRNSNNDLKNTYDVEVEQHCITWWSKSIDYRSENTLKLDNIMNPKNKSKDSRKVGETKKKKNTEEMMRL